jgi:hypothetical protein
MSPTTERLTTCGMIDRAIENFSEKVEKHEIETFENAKHESANFESVTTLQNLMSFKD